MKIESILQQLIQIFSVSGNEQKIQEWIYAYIAQLGQKPKWVGPNVVCHIAGKDRSKALIFNGHVDTVSPGDEKAWEHGPFSGKMVDGKIYGLGSSDMKSGVAVMLKLLEIYSKIQSPVDLWFCFVVREETDGSGTKKVMEWFGQQHQKQYKTIAGIIPEPTNLKKIEIAHKGNIFLKVTIKGDGGHGSTPEKIKLHAISKMHKVAKDLTSLVNSWQKKYKDDVLGIPTIAWTSIQAGDEASPNKIADTCTATFDIRTTPQIHEKALHLIHKRFSSASVKIKVLYPPLPCGYTDKAEHIVQVAKQVTHLPVGKTPGATDLLFFTKAGIPGIIIGPGEKELEHQVNEYVYLSKIEKCIKFMEEIINEF